jgi:hypothetical protein
VLNLDDYCFCNEAAEIISRNSDHAIRPSYVNRLVMLGVLHPVRVGGRRNLYFRKACEAVVVGRRSQICVEDVA